MSIFDKIKASFNKSAKQIKDLGKDFFTDRRVTLEKKPVNLEELKAAVDVGDPGSVAAYWVYAVACLGVDYDTGMSMMKYLFADLEPYGRGFTEGGGAGRAGWDPGFNERLKDDDFRWLPRAYFVGAKADNGFNPPEPLAVDLHYNKHNTEASNEQSFKALGRLNIVYWVQSNAAGNKVNITLSKFDGSERWYVTSGISSSGLFYDQRAGLTAEARKKLYQ